jgi:hypothetical protein
LVADSVTEVHCGLCAALLLRYHNDASTHVITDTVKPSHWLQLAPTAVSAASITVDGLQDEPVLMPRADL